MFADGADSTASGLRRRIAERARSAPGSGSCTPQTPSSVQAMAAAPRAVSKSAKRSGISVFPEYETRPPRLELRWPIVYGADAHAMTDQTAQIQESIAANRELWTRSNAQYTDGRAHDSWLAPEITWGVWNVP